MGLLCLRPGVFTECYRKDEERAQKLLIRVSEAWGKTTCLQLALEAKDMKFVSHGGIQVTSQGYLPETDACGAFRADTASCSRSRHAHSHGLQGPQRLGDSA